MKQSTCWRARQWLLSEASGSNTARRNRKEPNTSPYACRHSRPRPSIEMSEAGAKGEEQRAKGKGQELRKLGDALCPKGQLTASDGPDSASSFFWIHMPAI